MVAALKARRRLQLEEQVAAREWEDHSLVFPNRFGRVTNYKSCVHRDFFRDTWRPLASLGYASTTSDTPLPRSRSEQALLSMWWQRCSGTRTRQ